MASFFLLGVKFLRRYWSCHCIFYFFSFLKQLNPPHSIPFFTSWIFNETYEASHVAHTHEFSCRKWKQKFFFVPLPRKTENDWESENGESKEEWNEVNGVSLLRTEKKRQMLSTVNCKKLGINKCNLHFGEFLCVHSNRSDGRVRRCSIMIDVWACTKVMFLLTFSGTKYVS